MAPPSGPGGTLSAAPTRPRLQRPNTVCFEIPGPTSSRARYPEVSREVGRMDFNDDIACFQPRGSESFLLSFKCQMNALRLVEDGITVGGRHYSVSEVTGGTTVITVYDAPYELPHTAIRAALSHYGEVKSVEHQKVPTEIGDFFNGDRKVVLAMKKPVPNILNVDGFEVTCWYRKVTKLCRRCGATDHLAAACPTPVVPTPKRCGNCGNRWHNLEDCKGCRTCRTEGHQPDTCPLLEIKTEAPPPAASTPIAPNQETEPDMQEISLSEEDPSMEFSDSTVCASPPRPSPTKPAVQTASRNHHRRSSTKPQTYRIPRMPPPDVSDNEYKKYAKRWNKFMDDPKQPQEAKDILQDNINDWLQEYNT